MFPRPGTPSAGPQAGGCRQRWYLDVHVQSTLGCTEYIRSVRYLLACLAGTYTLRAGDRRGEGHEHSQAADGAAGKEEDGPSRGEGRGLADLELITQHRSELPRQLELPQYRQLRCLLPEAADAWVGSRQHTGCRIAWLICTYSVPILPIELPRESLLLRYAAG